MASTRQGATDFTSKLLPSWPELHSTLTQGSLSLCRCACQEHDVVFGSDALQ